MTPVKESNEFSPVGVEPRVELEMPLELELHLVVVDVGEEPDQDLWQWHHQEEEEVLKDSGKVLRYGLSYTNNGP